MTFSLMSQTLQASQSASNDVLMLQHFIDGVFQPSESGETFDDLNPATGAVLAKVALGGEAEINLAVAVAKRAFESGVWKNKSLTERCAILKRVGDLILQNKEALARAETLDTGKPITESLEGDIPRAAQNFHFFADYAPKVCTGETFNSGSPESHGAERHETKYDPLGVVGLITPWNLPLYLATWKIAPALAMGNSCVLKPAEWTPYTATLLCELMNEAGVPPGVFNVVHGFGPNSAGEALTRHSDVKAISFTGETGTGRAIMAAASATLKKVSFELGGKGANIIFDDADLDEAIPTALRAAFRNQGQICLAGSRLFVQQGVYDDVVKKLVAGAESLRVGDPLEPATQMGALIHGAHLEKVFDYIALAKKDGRILTGGERIVELKQGNFLKPTIVVDAPNTSRVCQEEIFGPVLTILSFQDETDVLKFVNSVPYGLSASVWSEDLARCERMAEQIQCGMVWVNSWFLRDLRTPFGGQKASGVGREGGRWSLEFFSDLKTVSYRQASQLA